MGHSAPLPPPSLRVGKSPVQIGLIGTIDHAIKVLQLLLVLSIFRVVLDGYD